MDEFDAPLLRKSVEWVLEQSGVHGPEREWNQLTWGEGRVLPGRGFSRAGDRYRRVEILERVNCGTSCCVAGKVCLVAGDTFVINVDDEDGVVRAGTVVEVSHVMTAEGDLVSISDRAQALLGITDNETGQLFSGLNNASSVLRKARVIAHAHGEELGL